ncbi:MAG: bifunctional adenosylcobinamide kinase/adenosylcobinamide-phosphate guanylyltransferase [Lachnospiraceae bacterium]|nr:bifunctional adenosylcobinamide kinase/adenosylcobinamide-phosphate guanylyltransferase [Lachnospiraceae bacterium]
MVFIIGGAADSQQSYAARHYPDAKIIGNYHLKVQEELKAGLDPLKEAEKLLQDIPSDRQTVIWSCEIGCGIVPADPEARAWREASGRVNCYLAANAGTVIRMVCGIGTVIKGGNA